MPAMAVTLAKPMRPEEFLAWEERQELRHEFDGVQPVAMAGGTRAHARIQRNLAISIGGRLRGKPCEFLGSDLKISAGRSYRYPDGFVTCSQGRGTSTVVDDPVVVFEVLSPATAGVDQITKNQEYAAIPSVRHYVMLAHDRVGATVFARADEDWVGHVIAGDAILVLPEIDVTLPLVELYDGVDFSVAEGE